MDLKFLYNRYVHHAKRIDGYLWDWPKQGMLFFHNEDFLNDIILKKGYCFVDVGANVGAWSIRASPFYQVIHAFEPNKTMYQALKRNAKLNKCRNIDAWDDALDMVDGWTSQAIIDSSSLGQPYQQMIKARVATFALDTLKLKNISVLKLDVEGAAMRIVKGGFKTISLQHPTMIVEVHTKEESEIPRLLPEYNWKKEYRPAPNFGDWLYLENGLQVFLIGRVESI